MADTVLPHFPSMEVNLTKRIDTPEGRRYYPAIITANGRAKPNWVLVNGRPEKYESGVYYLEWYENGKRWVGNVRAKARFTAGPKVLSRTADRRHRTSLPG